MIRNLLDMNLHKFLKNEGKDFKGRYLSDIWLYSDKEIDSTHDFIQLLFPLAKPSDSVRNGHYLQSKSDVEKAKNDIVIRRNILKSSKWFYSFLRRNNQWKENYNHNQLRITRAIECLRLVVSDFEADDFYKQIRLLFDKENQINKTSLAYWKKA